MLRREHAIHRAARGGDEACAGLRGIATLMSSNTRRRVGRRESAMIRGGVGKGGSILRAGPKRHHGARVRVPMTFSGAKCRVPYTVGQ